MKKLNGAAAAGQILDPSAILQGSDTSKNEPNRFSLRGMSASPTIQMYQKTCLIIPDGA